MPVLGAVSRSRNPHDTRQRLIRAALLEFQRIGYQDADLNRILQQAGVTKGALYHHFRSKKELGYVVVEECLSDWIVERWLAPVEQREDLLDALVDLARWGERSATPQALTLGCPLLTLSQELCGVDVGFQQRLAAIYDRWRDGLAELLRRARDRGGVRSDVDLSGAATFIIASWEGSIGLGKVYGSTEVLGKCRLGLESYLETLRPSPEGH